MAFSRTSLMGKLECFRKPSAHSQAKFLGAGVWEIEGSHYFGDVTIIGPKPDMDMSYPCSFRCPDTRRGVLIIVPERKVNRPGAPSPPAAEITEWLRIGRSSDARYWNPNEDALALGPPVAPQTAGHVLRADEDAIYWAHGQAIYRRPIDGGAATEYVQAGDVLAMWLEGSLPWAIVKAEGDWSDGWSDGFAAGSIARDPDNDQPAYWWGEQACLNETGYEPWLDAYDNPIFFTEIPVPTAPPLYLDDYRVGFVDGWTDSYRQGYESGGCTPDD